VKPVLVETTKSILGKLASPYSGKSSQSSGGLDVPDNTHNDEGWGFDDGYGFNGFLLMQLRSHSIDISEDVGHTSLEACKGSQVYWFLGIIARE